MLQAEKGDDLDCFYVVMRPHKRKGQLLLQKVLDAITHNGFRYSLEDWVCESYPALVPPSMPGIEQCSAVISAGGDGTFLSAAEVAVKYHLPILGVNLGRVGFLTEVELRQVDEAFSLLRRGDYTLQELMLLEAVIGDQKALALNDVVVNRGEYSKSIDLDVFVENEPLGRFIADGFIVSTPTGSTGYTFSAGGPVVSSKMNCMALTPVCAHSLFNRTVIVPPDETVCIGMHEKRSYQVMVSCDGRPPVQLGSRDKLLIRTAQERLHVIHIYDHAFFQRVKSKLNH